MFRNHCKKVSRKAQLFFEVKLKFQTQWTWRAMLFTPVQIIWY